VKPPKETLLLSLPLFYHIFMENTIEKIAWKQLPRIFLLAFRLRLCYHFLMINLPMKVKSKNEGIS